MARPRKSGKRTKAGRLSRPAAARRVSGNDRAEAKKLLYGQEGVDAIGRAWRMGLLGEPAEARDLVMAARTIARRYRIMFEHGKIRCALNQSVGGSHEDDEEVKRQRRMIRKLLVLDQRPASFDELVLDHYPDTGPAWLDRLILAKRFSERLPNNWERINNGIDGKRLRAALKALRAVM